MNDVQASLLEAIDILSKGNDTNNVQTITIEANIVSIDDVSQGLYTVNYLGNNFKAMSVNRIYTVNQKVYVLVPNGDFTKNKIILSPVDVSQRGIINIEEDEQLKYIELTPNLIQGTGELALCSYNYTGDENKHSQYDIKEWALNTKDGALLDMFKQIAKESRKFKFSFNLQTDLDDDQQLKRGEYYIRFIYETTAGINEAYMDIRDFEGNPYSLGEPTYQSIIFEIPENSEIITSNNYPKIEVGCRGFLTPYENTTIPMEIKDKSDEYIEYTDIFFSDFKLICIDDVPSVPDKDIVVLSTISGGLIFNPNDEEEQTLTLQACLKTNDVKVDLSADKHMCYWFIQDASVKNANSAGYHTSGGIGWRCVNSTTTTVDKDKDGNIIKQNTYYTPDVDFQLNVKSSSVPFATVYKCVIVYLKDDNSEVYAEGTVTLRQEQTDFNFNITANSKIYYKGASLATLTASIDKQLLTNETLSFDWLCYDKNGKIRTDWKIIKDYPHFSMEGEKQICHRTVSFGTADIDEKNIITCTVTSNKFDAILATASYTVEVTINNGIQLVLINHDVSYKYDANGLSPYTKEKLSMDLTIPPIEPITFEMLKSDMTPFTEDEYAKCTCTWECSEKSLIVPTGVQPSNGIYTISGNEFVYTIRDNYSEYYYNNEVTCKVAFDGAIYSKTFRINFFKDGDNGTNGTDYTAQIYYEEKNIEENKIERKQLVFRRDNARNLKSINNPKLKVEVFKQNKKLEAISYTIKWEFLSTFSGITINNEGQITIPNGDFDAARPYIVKATISVDDTILYAFYCIETCLYENGVFEDNENDLKNLHFQGGAKEVLFSSDGTVIEKISSEPVTLEGLYSNFDTNDLSWRIINEEYLDVQENSKTQITVREKWNIKNLKNKFYEILEVAIGSFTYRRPILLRKNTYGISGFLNAWDGMSLKLSDADNYIYAAQMGAGKKEGNAFTGVIMGEGKVGGDSNAVGLFGYQGGAQTFFLDAKTGSAYFKGEIEAETGYLKDLNINGKLYLNGGYLTTENLRTSYKQPLPGMTLDKGGIGGYSSSNKFWNMSAEGQLTAAGVDISGKITAGDGLIGGFKIGTNSISAQSSDGLRRVILHSGSSDKTDNAITIQVRPSTGTDNWVSKIRFRYDGSAYFAETDDNNAYATSSVSINSGRIVIKENSPTNEENTWPRLTFNSADDICSFLYKGSNDKRLLWNGSLETLYSIYCNGNITCNGIIDCNGNISSKTGSLDIWGNILTKSFYQAYYDKAYSILGFSGREEEEGWVFVGHKDCNGLSLRGGTVKLDEASGIIGNSDERLKNSFKTLEEFDNVYMNLNPIAFKYNNGTSDRFHFGFGAAQVRDSFTENGFTTKDFGGFVQMQGKEDNVENPMGLIYTEFVSWNTHMIQKTIKKVEEQQNEIDNLKDRLNKLEALLLNN